MNQFIQHLREELSTTELFIGIFSFIIGGIGIITVVLIAWNFIVTVFG